MSCTILLLVPLKAWSVSPMYAKCLHNLWVIRFTFVQECFCKIIHAPWLSIKNQGLFFLFFVVKSFSRIGTLNSAFGNKPWSMTHKVSRGTSSRNSNSGWWVKIKDQFRNINNKYSKSEEKKMPWCSGYNFY